MSECERGKVKFVFLSVGYLPEEHWRFTTLTGTSSGNPAKNIAILHSFALWDPEPITLPITTSPTSPGAIPVSEEEEKNKR